MGNIGRREFITGMFSVSPFFVPSKALARKSHCRVHVILPEVAFQLDHKKGREKGGKILVVGGIHGNEPGAYMAAEILRHVEVLRGELFVAPRVNFVSILANVRGYNGDMNRKFSSLSPKDPDFENVTRLKSLIKEGSFDAVLSLHDGYGFHAFNRGAWGQSIVIDDEVYKGFPLGRIAKDVLSAANKKIGRRRWKLSLYNTRTFLKHTPHPEQKKSLTYYCLSKCSTMAFCLEASKQLPDIDTKVKVHLLMLEEFFRKFGIAIKPSFGYLLENYKRVVASVKNYRVDIEINGRRVSISSSKVLRVPDRSEVVCVGFSGTNGTNVIPYGVNLNWRRFTIRKNFRLRLKEDFKEIFDIRFVII